MSNSRKLDNLEELIIIRHTLDLYSHGFQPRLAGVEDIGNKLLASWNSGIVGKQWAFNFVKRTPELIIYFN